MAMQYATLPGINKKVSRLVQGTIMLMMDQKEAGLDLLDMAWANGSTAFDCAHVYGGGQSERVLGEWLTTRGNREEVVILTKGCHPNHDRKRVTPFDLTSDLFDSLARLKSDYIDVYVLHRDDPDVPVGPIVEALNEHFEAGRIRAFGGSNWTHQRLAEANQYAADHGLVPFSVSSPNFGLAEQVLDPWGPGCVTLSGPQEVKARAWYEANQMPVFAYSSIGRGFFSGRVKSDSPEDSASILDGAAQHAYAHPVNFRRLERAESLARQKGVTVPQIALAFILSSPLNVFPLVAAYNEAEFKDNLKTFDVQLTPEERDWLDLK
ncbi:MAG: aldo/keto reductase [Anaerolineaceae bacterium]|nr:aldo/keto reductase [Anaerolineaceae bacterium]